MFRKMSNMRAILILLGLLVVCRGETSKEDDHPLPAPTPDNQVPHEEDATYAPEDGQYDDWYMPYKPKPHRGYQEHPPFVHNEPHLKRGPQAENTGSKKHKSDENPVEEVPERRFDEPRWRLEDERRPKEERERDGREFHGQTLHGKGHGGKGHGYKGKGKGDSDGGHKPDGPDCNDDAADYDDCNGGGSPGGEAPGCRYVSVNNLRYQSSRRGRYSRITRKCEHEDKGRVVYKQDRGPNYLFFMRERNGWQGWQIGTKACKNQAGVAAKDNATVPELVTAVWEEYHLKDDWIPNPSVTVMCTSGYSVWEIISVVIVSIVLVGLIISIVTNIIKKRRQRREERMDDTDSLEGPLPPPTVYSNDGMMLSEESAPPYTFTPQAPPSYDNCLADAPPTYEEIFADNQNPADSADERGGSRSQCAPGSRPSAPGSMSRSDAPPPTLSSQHPPRGVIGHDAMPPVVSRSEVSHVSRSNYLAPPCGVRKDDYHGPSVQDTIPRSASDSGPDGEEPRNVDLEEPRYTSLQEPRYMDLQEPRYTSLQEPRYTDLQEPRYMDLQEPMNLDREEASDSDQGADPPPPPHRSSQPVTQDVEEAMNCDTESSDRIEDVTEESEIIHVQTQHSTIGNAQVLEMDV